jgi:teichoic acid transport system permease protein
MLLIIKSANGITVETSWLGVSYFIILTYLFLLPVCIIISLVQQRSREIAAGLVILLMTLPILWIPSSVPGVLLNILKLNPFYFLVNGFQESMVIGISAFYNYPNHLLFLVELILVYIWAGYLYKLLKDELNMKKH